MEQRMTKLQALKEKLQAAFGSDGSDIEALHIANNEITLTIPTSSVINICQRLRDENDFRFEMLIDLCGVDYLHYGCSEWVTTGATLKGFERAVRPIGDVITN